MPNLVMDFINGVVKPFAGTAEGVATDVGNLEARAAQEDAKLLGYSGNIGLGGLDNTGQTLGNNQTNVSKFGKDLGGYAGSNSARNQISNVAQVGVSVLAPAISKPAEGLASPLIKGAADVGGNVAGKVGSKLLGGAVKGAVGGATVGGAQGVAQGIATAKNPGDLGLDFIHGAVSGMAQGAVFGAASAKGSGTMTSTGAVGGATGTLARKIMTGVQQARNGLIDDDTAQELANEKDPSKIEKTLEPIIGDVVAQDIAPAVAQTNDPNIVKNVVENDINKKTAPALPPEPPTPLPPPSSTDNLNTNQDVSAEEESLINSAPQNIPQELPPEKPFLNAPGDQSSSPSHVSHVQTMQEMNDILNRGGTVDEALSHYMEKTNADYGTAQDAFQQLRGQDKESLNQGNINASLNPRYEEGQKLVGSEIPKGDTDSVMTKTRMAYNAVMREGTKAILEVRQLSPQDLTLMDEARDKTPEEVGKLAETAKDPEQFLRAYQATKNYDDFAQGLGSGGLGQEVAYRQNHLLTKYMETPDEEALRTSNGETPDRQPNLLDPDSQARQATRPGYAMGRQSGGIPKFDNFLQDLEFDVNNKSSHIGQLTFSKSLGEAFPDQVAQGNLPGGYAQVRLPFAKGVSLPTELADEVNKRAPVNTSGILKGYDTVNSVMKNLKLGGGLFHFINVAGTFIGQQIASGKLFSHPEDAANVIKSTFSTEAMNDKMSELDDQGMLRAADRLGLEYNKFGVQADVGAHSKLDNIPLLKQIHESTFGRQIPMMKMLTLQQKLADNGIDPKNMSEEDIQTGTKLAKEINNNYGGINRMIQGLTPGQFKVMSRVLLATDYTEGQLKTLVDAFSKGGADGKLAREAVIGKALLFAGIATTAGAIGGEFKGQTPKQVAEDILMKTINPKFQFGGYTVGLPETQLSEFAKPIAESIGNAQKGDNAANPFKDFLTARLAAVPSEAEQLATNRNFQGNPLHGTDYYGRPISSEETLANVLGGALPIPASNAAQTATGQENPAEAVANTAGLNVSPTYPVSYAPVAGQTYIQELEKTPGVSQKQIAADTKYFDLLEQGSHDKNKVLTQMETAIAQKKPKEAEQLMNAYNENLISTLLPWAKAGGTVYLDTTMLSLLKTAQITYKKANENVAYDVKTNPTAYGVPVAALAQTPETVSSPVAGV